MPTSKDLNPNMQEKGKATPENHHKHHLPHLPKTNGTTTVQPPPTSPRRSSLLHRSHADKTDSSDPTPPSNKSQKDSRPSGSRKSSWVSSLSSKFSSNSNAAAKSSEPSSSAKTPRSPSLEHANPFGSAAAPNAKDDKKAQDTATGAAPGSPGKPHGFLQSAMRRLSSSGAGGMGKAATHGGICPRRTMNVDPYRERCTLPELEQKKLRRVAFCVDVEIAGSAQYGQDNEAEAHQPSLSIHDESPQSKLEREMEEKKIQRDQELKQSEGAALKRAASNDEEKDSNVDENVSPELAAAEPSATTAKVPTQPKEMTRKKEKKKRSEEERKGRKEKKQRDALADGKIPAEIHKDGGSSSSSLESSHGAESPTKAQDRPTTDPLRIYRRCCQLRETPILKKVVEQISSPTVCPVDTPGIISSLDLSGYMMQLPDIVTLGDYLAVVPVKKLNMENCGLGDEAVRVILAGLLAAKTPEQAKFNKKLNKKPKEKAKGAVEKLGVVEKVNFKNNPKIGKQGWRHIALFLYLSRSLKAIDLSMIPFPRESSQEENGMGERSPDAAAGPEDLSSILQEAISTRLAGEHLEELVMSNCHLSTLCVGRIVDAVMKSGVTRLGLASNDLAPEGLQHVLRYLQSASCYGLDIGGNRVIHEQIDELAKAIDDGSPLFAMSLADCNLDPVSLEKILSALLKLTNFRFIDFSHNRDLFTSKPSCLKSLRKYLPQFPILKRIHLMDVAMTSEHAIALAEVLPECKNLAHLSILENHLLVPLADAKTETLQEEASAFYASFMAAVRVSQTIICIDLEVPSADSSEIVKALAKQVVAYSLRNLERLPLPETTDSAIAAMTRPHQSDKDLSVPDILLQLVGHVEGYPENHDHDAPAPDNDYIVGGTGVVKALDICLRRSIDGRKGSLEGSPMDSGAVTPHGVLQDSEVTKGKARDMSRNLLDSARKIRARLQPALVKEAKTGNEMDLKRLQFLDTTLRGMIQRFEDEYPETRIAAPTVSAVDEEEPPEHTDSSNLALKPAPSQTPAIDSESPKGSNDQLHTLSRQSSSRSLATRQAQEEGHMHRFGQRLRREVLKPDTEDVHHGTSGTETPPLHMVELRKRLEELDGPEIQSSIHRLGIEGVLDNIVASKKDLEELENNGVNCQEMRATREKALQIWRDEMRDSSGPLNGSMGEKDAEPGI